MYKNKKLLFMLVICMSIMISSFTNAYAATKRISIHRGSSLMWSKTTIDWSYSGGKITNSLTDQQCGWIFPNIVRENGVVNYVYDSGHIRKTSKYTLGAGVPTPWGDIKVYNTIQYDVAHIYGSGNSYWE